MSTTSSISSRRSSARTRPTRPTRRRCDGRHECGQLRHVGPPLLRRLGRDLLTYALRVAKKGIARGARPRRNVARAPGAAPGQRARAGAHADDVLVQKLGGGFHVLKAGAINVLAVPAADGVALVDGGRRPSPRRLLAARRRAAGRRKIHTLFNTHWHPEQTGSNETLGKAGATIVAQENTQQWLSTDVTWPWNNETVQPLPASRAARQNLLYDATSSTVGRQARAVRTSTRLPAYGRRHVRVLPEAMCLRSATRSTGAGWPSIDWWTGGWIGGIVGGHRHAADGRQAETRIVPARGRVLTRADLKTPVPDVQRGLGAARKDALRRRRPAGSASCETDQGIRRHNGTVGRIRATRFRKPLGLPVPGCLIKR